MLVLPAHSVHVLLTCSKCAAGLVTSAAREARELCPVYTGHNSTHVTCVNRWCRRSIELPKRDEEKEVERKAKAKRARESRRSTQAWLTIGQQTCFCDDFYFYLSRFLQCLNIASWVIRPVKTSSPKWPKLCSVGRWTLHHLLFCIMSCTVSFQWTVDTFVNGWVHHVKLLSVEI